MFSLTAVFHINGYKSPEINLIPAICLALIIGVVYLVGATTFR